MIQRWIICLALASTAFAVITDPEDYDGFRLPATQFPSSYLIELFLENEVFDGSSTVFTGTAEIIFTLTEPSDVIQIHSRVTLLSVQLQSAEHDYIGILGYSTNTTNDILTINLASNLTTTTNYILNIRYVGNLATTEMQGFYRSQYTTAAGATRYLVTTQFQPTHARAAFPCFDEPRYKATFAIAINYPAPYTALGNTPAATPTGNATHLRVTFAVTPPMSSYLIAFIVSDFTCTTDQPIETNVPHQICSRTDAVAQRATAIFYGPQIMHSMEGLLGLTYAAQGFAKMDQVAIPDFSAGAMENWGLVTYRERLLLWDAVESSNRHRQNIISVIAHEFAHMWFGNLVTCEWWDYLFLNEGWATYFEYFAIAELFQLEVVETWEMANQFIVDHQHRALVTDGFNTSAALTAKASSATQVWGKFNAISYSKGGSVYRMLEHVMGKTNFFNGLQNYLTMYSGQATAPSHLWNAIQPSIPANTLPNNLGLSAVMENWTNRAGYPLITVSAVGNNAEISQRRFVYSGTAEDTEWYVPISYTVASDANRFETVTPSVWLSPGSNQVLTNALVNNNWIILNNQASAYYRVNYDATLWNRISTLLNATHTDIHVLNRAQIVDDLLNLARANELQYSEALDILRYLVFETEYYPWVPALSGFDYVLRLFGETSPVGIQLNALLRDMIQGVYQTVSFTTVNDTDQIGSLKLPMILARACRLGEINCINSALLQFQELRTNAVSVNKNLRTVVYCNGLRHSTDIATDWTFLWQRYQASSLSTEQVTILSALGCTTNPTYLTNLLEYSLDPTSGIRMQDLTVAWSAVYASTPAAAELAFDYLVANYERVHAYSGQGPALLSAIVSYFTTDEQIAKVEQLISDETTHAGLQTSAPSALATIRTNQEWVSTVRYDLETYFGLADPTTTPSTTTDSGINLAVSTTLTIVSIVICKLLI